MYVNMCVIVGHIGQEIDLHFRYAMIMMTAATATVTAVTASVKTTMTSVLTA